MPTADLPTERFGQTLVWEPVASSTNDRAAAALRRAALPEGAVFVADRQLRGRGTAGRRWSSDHGGLWLSLVLGEPLRATPLPFLPGLAVVELLREDFGIDAHVKWPNDVLVEGRKLSGTLIEAQRTAAGTTAWVVGVGVNVDQQRFDDEIADLAVSMRMLTGTACSRHRVFRRLMVRMEALYDSTPDLVPLWRRRTRMLGRRVQVRRAGASFGCTVLDITAEGHLQVVLDEGRREIWVASHDLSIDPRYA